MTCYDVNFYWSQLAVFFLAVSGVTILIFNRLHEIYKNADQDFDEEDPPN